MGKFIQFEYDDVKKFAKDLNKRAGVRNVDSTFRKICDVAMENTLDEAEKRTPVWTGELKSSWRKNVKSAKKQSGSFIATATNKAYNEEAKAVGMDPYYAEFVEEGHKKVPWRKRTHGVHMLAEAEEDTRRKMEKIITDEMKKLLGGLFD